MAQTQTGTVSWDSKHNKGGHFVREDRTFRSWVSDAPDSEFPLEAGRYHLYVSYACPWAHRTLIVRKLKGLEDVISFDVVDFFLDATGWTLQAKSEGATLDSVQGLKTLREIYKQCDPDYSKSVTVPVLYDKKKKTIVNNESSEIIRMFNTSFNKLATKNKDIDLYPSALQQQIDDLNSWVYTSINNGVYRCGFATTQEAYNEAFGKLFEGLDKVENILSNNRYLLGEVFTEADVRLITTLLRFDTVYVTHFKTNKKRITDYPSIWNYLKDLYQLAAIRETTNMYHIKHHYFESHRSINPHGIVANGPDVNFDEPNNRSALTSKSKFD